MQTRKIGIMGGTFNPIHFAHLRIAENAREQFGLDRVIFIPSGKPYLKTNESITDGEIRYHMVKQAINDNPYFTVSRLEIDRKGDTHTIDTLSQLQQMYPGDELYFIMGSDSFLSLESWFDFETIFEKATILTAARNDESESKLINDIDKFKAKYNADIRLINSDKMDISSSLIRSRITTGKSVRYLLPDSCIEYICMKNLYRPASNPLNEQMRIWLNK